MLKEKLISFRPNLDLMCLIQQATNQSTDEILGFFYDLGKEIMVLGLSKVTGKAIRAKIIEFYPGTSIPFTLLVKATKPKGNWVGFCQINVLFPCNRIATVDTKKLMEMIFEKQLLDAPSLLNFEAPKAKIPKLYKDLVEKTIKSRTK